MGIHRPVGQDLGQKDISVSSNAYELSEIGCKIHAWRGVKSACLQGRMVIDKNVWHFEGML